MNWAERDVRAGWRLTERSGPCGMRGASTAAADRSALAAYEGALGRYRSELPRPSDRAVSELQSAEAQLRSALAARYGEATCPDRRPETREGAKPGPAPRMSWLRIASAALLSLANCSFVGDMDQGAVRTTAIANEPPPRATAQYRLTGAHLDPPQSIELIAE